MILRWYYRAKDRILFSKVNSKKRRIFESKLCPIMNNCLGEPILVDGFNSQLENRNKCFVRERSLFQPSKPRISRSRTLTRTKSFFSQKQQEILNSSMAASSIVHMSQQKLRSISAPAELFDVSKHKNENTGIRSVTPQQKARSEAKKMIYQRTGKTSSEIASKSFEMGQKMENMGWTSQMNTAMKFSVNLIEGHRKI